MTQQEIQAAINAQQSIILDREAQLKTKDYIGTKIAMGVATREDYAGDIAKTEQWRADINAAQAEIARLEAVEPEEPTAESEPTM